ncbi:MAG TPA: Trm112 family protein [Steroidobacteraceae bacterium]
MDKRLLDLLVCPICKGPLRSFGSGSTLELICRPDRLAYAVREGIPVMLPEDARTLPADDPLLDG